MAKFVHLQESGFGKTFSTPITMPAFIRRFRDGRGRVFFLLGGARVEIFGAGQGKGQNLQGDAGQNLSISADLDNLLKEGEP